MGQSQASKFEKFFTLICTDNYDELSRQFRSCSTSEQLKALSNLCDVEKSASLLMYAAFYGHLHIARLLLESGANLLSRDKEGRNALFYAIAGQSTNIVQYFIETSLGRFDAESRANFLNTTDVSGDTCLHEAIKLHAVASIELLLKHQVDVNIMNHEGITALHRAVDLGHHDVVHLLLKSKADLNTKDSSGWTPLHVAVAHNDVELVRLLINRGARLNVTDAQGHSPLKWARETGSQEVFAYLKSLGAKEFDSSTSGTSSQRNSQRSSKKQPNSPKATSTASGPEPEEKSNS